MTTTTAAPATGAKLGLTILEAAAATTLSRRTLYRAASDGRLRFTKVGSRTLIRPADLAAFLDQAASDSAALSPSSR